MTRPLFYKFIFFKIGNKVPLMMQMWNLEIGRNVAWDMYFDLEQSTYYTKDIVQCRLLSNSNHEKRGKISACDHLNCAVYVPKCIDMLISIFRVLSRHGLLIFSNIHPMKKNQFVRNEWKLSKFHNLFWSVYVSSI